MPPLEGTILRHDQINLKQDTREFHIALRTFNLIWHPVEKIKGLFHCLLSCFKNRNSSFLCFGVMPSNGADLGDEVFCNRPQDVRISLDILRAVKSVNSKGDESFNSLFILAQLCAAEHAAGDPGHHFGNPFNYVDLGSTYLRHAFLISRWTADMTSADWKSFSLHRCSLAPKYASPELQR